MGLPGEFFVKFDTKVGWRVILWDLFVVYGQFDVFRSGVFRFEFVFEIEFEF